MIGATLCLVLSGIFHWFLIYSKRTKDIMSRLDYGGIVLMITGSTFPPIMYGYACQNLLRYIILTIVTFASFMAFILTLIPGGNSRTFRTIRGILFSIAGISAAIPILCATFNTNSIPFWATGHILYGVGGFFYVTRIPERYAPGKFDFFVMVKIVYRDTVIIYCI